MTRSSHSTRRHPGKHAIWLTPGAVAVWALVVATGTRLPYLYTQFASDFRSFGLFPSLLGLLAYFLFVYRRPRQKVSLYAMRMNRFNTTGERIKETAGMVFGALVICGGIAWTSVAFPAWATQLFASENQELVYQVEKISERSGPVWRTLFDLTLVDPASGEAVDLRLTRSRFERGRWKPGDRICVTGRTGPFGTIIDQETRCL